MECVNCKELITPIKGPKEYISVSNGGGLGSFICSYNGKLFVAGHEPHGDDKR